MSGPEAGGNVYVTGYSYATWGSPLHAHSGGPEIVVIKMTDAVPNDFNGDSKTDILWRNTAYGDNVIWYMDGPNFIGWAQLMTVPDPDWTIVGTGYFNDDGKPDILWRNTNSGENVVWQTNGATFIGWDYVLPTVTDPRWKIVGR